MGRDVERLLDLAVSRATRPGPRPPDARPAPVAWCSTCDWSRRGAGAAIDASIHSEDRGHAVLYMRAAPQITNALADMRADLRERMRFRRAAPGVER